MRILYRSVSLIFLFFSACTMPANNIPSSSPLPETLYTQAVETIVSKMTVEAGTPTIPAELPAQEITSTATPQPAVSATQLPTLTTTATVLPTGTSTSSPTIIPTQSSSDPRAGLGDPEFRDTFDTADNWPIYTDTHVKFEVSDGRMMMTAFEPDFYNGWMLSWINPTNFYLEITAVNGVCSGKDRYGVVFRAPNGDAGYLFGFSCDGRYSLWYWDGKKEIDIVDWTTSSLIEAGEGKTNRMGVKVNGDRFTLYANGSLLTEVQDDNSDKGEIGLFVGAAATANFTAFVEELAYWNLK